MRWKTTYAHSFVKEYSRMGLDDTMVCCSCNDLVLILLQRIHHFMHMTSLPSLLHSPQRKEVERDSGQAYRAISVQANLCCLIVAVLQ